MNFTAKTFALLAGVAMVVSGSTVSFAEGMDMNKSVETYKQSAQEAADQILANGTVESVNAQDGTLVIKTGLMSTEEFSVNSATLITDGGELLELASLQSGSEVKVQYVEESGKNVAKMISVKKS